MQDLRHGDRAGARSRRQWQGQGQRAKAGGRGQGSYFSSAVSAFSLPWLLSIHFSTRFPARNARLVLFFFPFSVPRILMTYMRQGWEHAHMHELQWE